MLPSKYLLNNSRYSIDRPICTGSAGTIYFATDTQLNAAVAIIERRGAASSDDPADDSHARTHHEGLVRISNDFEDRTCRYAVTEPVLTAPVRPPADASSCRAIFDRFGAILLALDGTNEDSVSAFSREISPEMFMLTAQGRLKLLRPGSAGFAPDSPTLASPFAPLEAVWESLDHITQKAIYNSYNEASLALLESPVDSRSGIYSLGAMFYKILTGKDPVSAVERSIEMLDSNADPLKSPSSLNPFIGSDQSDFIQRMLEVRRENRFNSIGEAVLAMPCQPQVERPRPEPLVEDPEEFSLLELPSPSVAVLAAPSANGTSAKANVPTLETNAVAATAAFRPPFTAAEKDFEPLPSATPASVIPKKKIEVEPDTRREQDDVFSGFETSEPARGGLMRYVALGAGALIVAVGIGWAALGGLSAKQADPAAAVAPPPVVVQQAQPPLSEPSQNAVAEPEGSTVETVDNPDVSETAKPRGQIAETRTPSQKTPKPVAKNGVKPSKKLTVDDLIN